MYKILENIAVSIGKKILSPSMAGYLLKKSNIKIIKTVSSKVLLNQRAFIAGYSHLAAPALRFFAKIVTKI